MCRDSVAPSFFGRPEARRSPKFLIRAVAMLAVLALSAVAPARAQSQKMKLLTPSTGWVSNNGHLYWTTDSGSRWTEITPIPPGVRRLAVGVQSVFFLNTQEGWAIISYPETVVPLTIQALRTRKTLYDIAQTVDGGETWSFLPLTYPRLPRWERDALAGPRDMFFLDSLHGWLVMAMMGSSNFAPGKLLATDDGGRNWKWVNGPGTIGTLLFTSTQDGWLAGGPGGGHLYATRDACESWREVHLPLPAEAGPVAFRVLEGPPIFNSNVSGFVAASYAGHEGEGSKLIVFSTGDNGVTWKPIKILPEPGYGGGAPVGALISDSVLLAPTGKQKAAVVSVPLRGALVSSVAVSRHSVLGMSFADGSHGLAESMRGRILYTSDGGGTWKNVTPWPVFRPKPSEAAPRITHPKEQIGVTNPSAAVPSVPETSAGGGSLGSNAHTSIHVGFDISCAPSTQYMGAWWTYSPYYDIGIYLGGVNVDCKNNTNLTSGWVGTVTGKAHGSTQGWGLIPILVGLQAPCYIVDPNHPQNFAVFGQDPNTPPYQQGYEEAVDNPGAGGVASGLGLSGTIIYYDMENYDWTDLTCAAKVEKFVGGWVAGLHTLGYLAGVYANPDPVNFNMGYASPPPDDIWITHWDYRATIFDSSAGWDDVWPAGKRSRQYLNDSETYGSVPLGIDRDIEDAPVAGADGTKTYTYSNFNALENGSDAQIRTDRRLRPLRRG